ncbi:MAG: potassium channel family protein [Cytophagales bacterium]|nr:potassium channel family protein [Cytophagales bacterium]
MKLNRKYNLIISSVGLLLVVIILNYVLVYVESRDPDSSIKTFSDALWYMIITLTTIGYGDLTPTTTIGTMIGYVFVFGSLGVLGYLISTLSSKYHTMMEEKKLGFRGTQFKEHVIFIGWNEFSRMVAEEIYHTSKKIAIVTHNKDQIDLVYSQFGRENTFALFADYNNLESLTKANVSEAAAVFISIPDDAQVLLYVIDFKKRYPKPQVVVSIENSKLKSTFKAAGVTYAIARNEIASKMVASYMFEPDVANLNYDLISSSRGLLDHDMQEYRMREDNSYVGTNYLDVFIDLKKTHNAVLIGLSRKKNGNWELITNPPEEEIIQVNDYLVLMCSGSSKKQLVTTFGVEEGRIIE